MMRLRNTDYSGLWPDAAKKIVVSLYQSHSMAPHEAIVFVASVGAPLQINAGLRIERKNGTTFYTICSVAPSDATTIIASCGASRCL
jgi:hypothetical protein